MVGNTKFESYNFTYIEQIDPSDGLVKCYNGTYKCQSQTEYLDDWLGPWISFLWLLFLIVSAFSIRMLYKTFITFRDTLTERDENGEYVFKEGCIYEHENALGCWNISGKPTIKKCKIIYFVYAIPLLIAWSDLFLDITYISSFTLNATRMISPYIEVRPAIFILMGIFDILGTFRIFLCSAMLWKFAERLYTEDEKLLARLETHMEMVVVAFAFILEDFAELFVEYFCVEKYITGYEYEKETAQSYTAALSSISLNLIALLCFIAFVMNFRKQQDKQSLWMNILSVIIPLFELVLSSLRTYRFIFQAFLWTKFRPGCIVLASNNTDDEGVPIYKAYQDTFSRQCFRPLDWIMVILMCMYAVILIVFIIVYITKIRPEYNLEMANMVPSNIVGDPKKLPKEMVKYIPAPIVKTTEVVADNTKKVVSYVMPGSKREVDYDPRESVKMASVKKTDSTKSDHHKVDEKETLLTKK